MRVGPRPVGVGEEVGVCVREVGGGGAVVLVHFVVGDVGPREVVGEDGPCPEAGGVAQGGSGDDFAEEVRGADEPVLVGDVGIERALPVAVPRGFGVDFAAGASLRQGVIGVEARIGPRGSMENSREGAALGPGVERAEFRARVEGGLGVGGAFL